MTSLHTATANFTQVTFSKTDNIIRSTAITFSDDDSACSFDSEEEEKLLTPPIQSSSSNLDQEEEEEPVINTIQDEEEEQDIDWGRLLDHLIINMFYLLFYFYRILVKSHFRFQ